MEKEKTFITGDLVEDFQVINPEYKEKEKEIDLGDPYEVFQTGYISKDKKMNQKVGAAEASRKYEALLVELEASLLNIRHHMEFYKHVEMRYKESHGDDAKISFNKLAEIRAIDKETEKAIASIKKFKENN